MSFDSPCDLATLCMVCVFYTILSIFFQKLGKHCLFILFLTKSKKQQYLVFIEYLIWTKLKINFLYKVWMQNKINIKCFFFGKISNYKYISAKITICYLCCSSCSHILSSEMSFLIIESKSFGCSQNNYTQNKLKAT